MYRTLTLLVGILAVVQPTSALAQTQEDAFPLPLTRVQRIAIANATLKERAELFNRPFLINRCSLNAVLDRTDPVADSLIQAPARSMLRGDRARDCADLAAEPLPARGLMITFREIRTEQNELLGLKAMPAEPRPAGLIVVQLHITAQGGLSWEEEWVMLETAPSVWIGVTTRIFGHTLI